MTTFRKLAILSLSLAASHLTSAAVPGSINYQGRLTNAAGVPQPGSHTMSLKIFDAATGGTQLYTEALGNVAADANGVYTFQFGASGTSDALVNETIAVTNGSSLTYQKTLANGPVLRNHKSSESLRRHSNHEHPTHRQNRMSRLWSALLAGAWGGSGERHLSEVWCRVCGGDDC